jgi:hypothetical protein
MRELALAVQCLRLRREPLVHPAGDVAAELLRVLVER